MSLWEDFQAELYGRKCIENEHGFILYKVLEDSAVYIHNIYVKPEKRKYGIAHKLEAALIETEKPKKLYCYVDLTTKNPELSLQVVLAAGYRIMNSDANSIVLIKELERV